MAGPNMPVPSAARLSRVIAEVSAETGVNPASIRDQEDKRREVSAARWEAWRRLHVDQGFGFSPIARAWGCNHASIIYARDNGWSHPSSRSGNGTEAA